MAFNLSKAKIKKLIQTNEDMGRISADVHVAISRCVESFVTELLDKSIASVETEPDFDARQGLNATNILKIVENDDSYDFLRDSLSTIDLSASKPKGSRAAPSKPRVKKQKTAHESVETDVSAPVYDSNPINISTFMPELLTESKPVTIEEENYD